MFSVRRIPGRVPVDFPPPADAPERERVETATIEGRLVGVEGSSILEILHLDVSGTDQYGVQRDLVTMVNGRVRITVEALDV